jgi:hypothetical protein
MWIEEISSPCFLLGASFTTNVICFPSLSFVSLFVNVFVEVRSEVALLKRNKYDSYLYLIEVRHEHIRVYKTEILQECVGERLM